MDFVDWFNPQDKEHLRAYETLRNTGAWPKGFVPKKVTFEGNWYAVIQVKLADAWIDHVLYNPEDM